MARGMLIDVTKCVGCGACVEACQQANGQPPHEARHFDQDTFTYLLDRGNDVYVRRLCMHCLNPACASACPIGALRKTAEGPVTYDPQRCMGCRYCMTACPFGVPTYEWFSPAPRVRKCEMCARRPQGPACAEACPTGATQAGFRDQLVAEAQRRIQEDPKTYYPYIYGLREAGGTSVLYIGPAEPEALGLPTHVGFEPLPQLTWRALKHVPDVVVFGGVLLSGFWWLTKRKEEVARHEGAHKSKEVNHDR
ncbi:MAG: 4Fe-4S dicluster domain-containing protein [Thermoanaerobaculum sp.]|nr:4Fe-4S dicluster domain-containing protein [Thermoanaerobaculum sp.]MCX7895817.1 4Fe-4S dicluster domain-containing protein [Thermoanaerobaculum sp.]MDW7968227.1 4Fe-4S dicluster domain-containing protein [Thermoanaerobaculum sp.]